MRNWLDQQQWWHKLRGHAITTREASREDDCLMFTVGRFGAIVPIMLDVCSCEQVW